MTVVGIHVLSELMKSHFIPKFLDNFDQEILETHKATIVF